MNEFAFKVIDAINREGLGNGQWGLAKDVDDSATYFGTEEETVLMGKWAYIYAEKDTYFAYIDEIEPTMVLHIEDCRLLLYRLDVE